MSCKLFCPLFFSPPFLTPLSSSLILGNLFIFLAISCRLQVLLSYVFGASAVLDELPCTDICVNAHARSRALGCSEYSCNAWCTAA